MLRAVPVRSSRLGLRRLLQVMGQLAQMLPPGVTTNSLDPKRPVCIISGSRKD